MPFIFQSGLTTLHYPQPLEGPGLVWLRGLSPEEVRHRLFHSHDGVDVDGVPLGEIQLPHSLLHRVGVGSVDYDSGSVIRRVNPCPLYCASVRLGDLIHFGRHGQGHLFSRLVGGGAGFGAVGANNHVKHDSSFWLVILVGFEFNILRVSSHSMN